MSLPLPISISGCRNAWARIPRQKGRRRKRSIWSRWARELTQANGCSACHSLDGSKLVGPTWKGIFGRTEALEDGSSVTADEAYLHTSITDPGAQIVAGFANLMPANYGDTLLPTEVDAIVEYLKTLE